MPNCSFNNSLRISYEAPRYSLYCCDLPFRFLFRNTLLRISHKVFCRYLKRDAQKHLNIQKKKSKIIIFCSEAIMWNQTFLYYRTIREETKKWTITVNDKLHFQIILKNLFVNTFKMRAAYSKTFFLTFKFPNCRSKVRNWYLDINNITKYQCVPYD